MWRVLSELREIADFLATWDALAAKDEECTVYQRSEWALAWARRFAAQRELRIFFLEEEGRPVAIFPMWVRLLFGIRVLEFIGSRGTDYLAPILDPCIDREQVYAAFIQHAYDAPIDIVSFEDIPRSHSLVGYCSSLSVIRAARITRTCQCYKIDLPTTWGTYTAGLSPRRRRDIEYNRRRINRYCDGPAFITRESSDSFPLHARLHQMRRNSLGHEGSYQAEEAVAFQQEITKAWEESGVLRLSFLWCNERPVASVLGALWRRREYALTLGLDPAVSRFRPGSTLLGLCIQQAIHDGARTFDLSRGDDPYKVWWGGREHENVHVVLGHNMADIGAYDVARRNHFAGYHFCPSAR